MAQKICSQRNFLSRQRRRCNVAAEAKARGFRKALVCSDPSLVKFGVSQKVTDILDKRGSGLYELFTDIKPNPLSKMFRRV